jgi:transcriptional regulator with XRE-family HTH domain
MTPVRLRVREWRDLREMSQIELAEKAGIRQATLSAIESGTTTRIDLESRKHSALIPPC